jgi:hypothetical protein
MEKKWTALRAVLREDMMKRKVTGKDPNSPTQYGLKT